MSGNETWDYIAAATLRFTESQAQRDWIEAVCYWLNRAASDSAVEFARLVKEGVSEDHARMSVQLSMDHAMGMQMAESILVVGYAEWREGAASEPGFGDVRY